MKFKLSDYAEKRIRQRKIKLEWIEAAIEAPDKKAAWLEGEQLAVVSERLTA